MSDLPERPYFVWTLNHALRPCPEKWSELDYGERNWKKRHVAGVKALSPSEWLLPLDDLARRYPLELL